MFKDRFSFLIPAALFRMADESPAAVVVVPPTGNTETPAEAAAEVADAATQIVDTAKELAVTMSMSAEEKGRIFSALEFLGQEIAALRRENADRHDEILREVREARFAAEDAADAADDAEQAATVAALETVTETPAEIPAAAAQVAEAAGEVAEAAAEPPQKRKRSWL